ncbi:MAG: hypothetical protein KAJ75_06870 [Alphaproteobacteria bacterium]|nr:hypothetical protein [Alphaproteobacteria bacterium]
MYLGYKEWLWNEEKDNIRYDQSKERQEIAKVSAKERKELYDRLMSRDITEYKVATDELSTPNEEDKEDKETISLTGIQSLTEEQKIEIETGKAPPKVKN